MLPQRIYKFLIIVLAIVAPVVQATSPCRVPDGCIDATSATFVGLIDVYERKCAEADIDHAEQYHESARASFVNDDAQFLARLRASAIYAQVVNEIELDVNRKEQRVLLKSCESFFAHQ